MAIVIIPSPLQKFTNYTKEVNFKVHNVSELLDELIINYPGLKNYLFEADEKIPSFINIFVDNEDIRNLEYTNTIIGENSVVSIIPAISGG